LTSSSRSVLASDDGLADLANRRLGAREGILSSLDGSGGGWVPVRIQLVRSQRILIESSRVLRGVDLSSLRGGLSEVAHNLETSNIACKVANLAGFEGSCNNIVLIWLIGVDAKEGYTS
jgi:hypothetical protein